MCVFLLLLKLHRRHDARLGPVARMEWVRAAQRILAQHYPEALVAVTARQSLYEVDRTRLERFLLDEVDWPKLTGRDVARYVDDLALLRSTAAISRLEAIRMGGGAGAEKASSALEELGVTSAAKIEELAGSGGRREAQTARRLYHLYISRQRDKPLAMSELRRLLGEPSAEFAKRTKVRRGGHGVRAACSRGRRRRQRQGDETDVTVRG